MPLGAGAFARLRALVPPRRQPQGQPLIRAPPSKKRAKAAVWAAYTQYHAGGGLHNNRPSVLHLASLTQAAWLAVEGICKSMALPLPPNPYQEVAPVTFKSFDQVQSYFVPKLAAAQTAAFNNQFMDAYWHLKYANTCLHLYASHLEKRQVVTQTESTLKQDHNATHPGAVRHEGGTA